MKGGGGAAAASAAPGDYVYFKSVVPLHKISIGPKLWRYYDFGPKTVPPLVCIPGIAGTADVYYKQIMSLSMKGYRVMSIDVPQVWNHQEWIHSFEKFLDSMNIHHVRKSSLPSAFLLCIAVLELSNHSYFKPCILHFHSSCASCNL
uniref:AB hydrolase-1 domain-containing protein n=1 Tax=Oryza glumipatula TaxID=40148 RepID=A0A0E0B8C1_9ORYZ